MNFCKEFKVKRGQVFMPSQKVPFLQLFKTHLKLSITFLCTYKISLKFLQPDLHLIGLALKKCVDASGVEK